MRAEGPGCRLALPRKQRVGYVAEVVLLAPAIEAVWCCQDGAFRRMNVEILGNADAFLYTHISPRDEWGARTSVEEAGLPRGSDPLKALSTAHNDLRSDLAQEVALSRNSTGFPHPA